MEQTDRVIFFIDGFNLYHSIDGKPELHKYKWLDIRGLTSAFVKKSQSVVDIYYFTAYAYWDADKVKRHKDLVEIYQDMGIKVVLGVFRDRPRKCHRCYKWFQVPEEKRTDVNIAIRLLDLAYKNAFDTACIISGDSDLIPAVEMVRSNFPTKNFKVIIPIGRKAKELTKACGGHNNKAKIKEKHLSCNLLADPYTTSGGRSISKPLSWS